mmetsp:Transcript_39713/g.88930  ORF Transcript_39713/g.88930 Transcript_39713/m.88930 type:complete len:953 (-) Transcript_39713:147-3005(-)
MLAVAERSETLRDMRMLSKTEEFEQPMAADEVKSSFQMFLQQSYGSVAKAWRRVLDPLGHGELLLSEFVNGLARTAWKGNTPVLWNALSTKAVENDGEDGQVLLLGKLDPEANRCIEDFRQWAQDSFGGPIEMLTQLASRANRSMFVDEFLRQCGEHNFEGDASIVASVMDLDDDGIIGIVDAAYFEGSALKRRTYLDPDFVMGLERAKKVSDKWKQRRQHQRMISDAALKEFHHKVRASSGGSLIRGWRRILDIYGNLSVSKIELLKGCRKMAFSGNVAALWKSLDMDDDGAVQLEDVEPRLALVLSFFRKWACEQHGSCANAMHYMANLLQQRHPKWTQQDLIVALHLAKFPNIPQTSLRQVSAILHEAMDVQNLGYITVQDAAFLDRWEPTPWLQAAPDPEGRAAFICALRERYSSSLVVGWRRLLDKSGTNRVFYKDFRDTCKLLECANPPGIWQCFHKIDGAGYITLADLDQASADALLNFKKWAEATFGGISHAFRSFDMQGNNELSYPEFRRALRKYGYEGDAKTLFLSLKPADSASRRINKDARLQAGDLKYLAFWECGDEVAHMSHMSMTVPPSPIMSLTLSSLCPNASATPSPRIGVIPPPASSSHGSAEADPAHSTRSMSAEPTASAEDQDEDEESDGEGPMEVAHAPVEIVADDGNSSSGCEDEDGKRPIPPSKSIPGCMKRTSTIKRAGTPFWDENAAPEERFRPTMSRSCSTMGRVNSANADAQRTMSRSRSSAVGDGLLSKHRMSRDLSAALPPVGVDTYVVAVQTPLRSAPAAEWRLTVKQLQFDTSEDRHSRNTSMVGHVDSLPSLQDVDDVPKSADEERAHQTKPERPFLPPIAGPKAIAPPRVRDFLSYCRTPSELKFVTYDRPEMNCSFSVGTLLDDKLAKSNASWTSTTAERFRSSQQKTRSRSPYCERPPGKFNFRFGSVNGLIRASDGW